MEHLLIAGAPLVVTVVSIRDWGMLSSGRQQGMLWWVAPWLLDGRIGEDTLETQRW
jgi:hypothetical protein